MLSIRKILLIITSVMAENAYNDCVYFDRESGFVKLPPLLSEANPVKIRMEVKAFNCDDMAMTMYIGNKYTFFKPVQGLFITISDNIGKYDINRPCNGLWHNGTFSI